MKMLPDTVAIPTTALNTTASGSAGVISISAPTIESRVAERWVIDWVAWSYDADPTSGSLTITDSTNSTDLLKIDITVGGPGQLVFGDRGLITPANTAITITLADGTAGKQLTVQYR